jgi:hypothetical protein
MLTMVRRGASTAPWSGGFFLSVFCPMSLSLAPQTGDVPEV